MVDQRNAVRKGKEKFLFFDNRTAPDLTVPLRQCALAPCNAEVAQGHWLASAHNGVWGFHSGNRESLSSNAVCDAVSNVLWA